MACLLKTTFLQIVKRIIKRKRKRRRNNSLINLVPISLLDSLCCVDNTCLKVMKDGGSEALLWVAWSFRQTKTYKKSKKPTGSCRRIFTQILLAKRSFLFNCFSHSPVRLSADRTIKANSHFPLTELLSLFKPLLGSWKITILCVTANFI